MPPSSISPIRPFFLLSGLTSTRSPAFHFATPGADLGDLARHVEADDDRQRHLDAGHAFDGEDVVVVERRGAHADDDVAFDGLRHRIVGDDLRDRRGRHACAAPALSSSCQPHPGKHPRPRDDVVADRGGEQPVADEHREGQHHEHRAELSMRGSGCASSARTNCGRKAKKKIDSFGLRMLIRIALTVTCRPSARRSRLSTCSAPRSPTCSRPCRADRRRRAT